jgi:hypothetical protein
VTGGPEPEKSMLMMMMSVPMASWRFFLSIAAAASLFELVVVLFQTSQMHQDSLVDVMGMQPWKTATSDLATMRSSPLMTGQRTLELASPEMAAPKEQYLRPRILVGILADGQTEESKEMRNRFRQLFQVWNDSRVCSLNEFSAKDWVDRSSYMGESDHDTSYDCQIVYSFVLSAYSRNNSLSHFTNEVGNTSTVKLHDTLSDPLVLQTVPSSNTIVHSDAIQPPYSDIMEYKDGIFLNIVENMNEGKTETFLYWASMVSQQYKIPFIAKCDTDTFIRIQKLLRFLHQELPRSPVSVNDSDVIPQSIVVGAMRNKPWKGGFLPTVDESFWRQQYFQGMHLYLNGGFYLMSHHLAELAVREARHVEHIIPNIKMDLPHGEYNDPHSYLEGAEDHDAIALAEQGLFRSPEYKDSFMQWLVIPKELRFFSHPVKSAKKWERILDTERAKIHFTPEIDLVTETSTSLENDDIKTVLVIFNATSASMRAKYRSVLRRQGTYACSALQQHMSASPCDVYYVFVVGDTMSGVKGEKESLRQRDFAKKVYEKDVLFLNVDNDNQLELGLAALKNVQANGKSDRKFALNIFCQSTHMVNIKSWYRTVVSPLGRSLKSQRNHHFLIGDVRDKMKNRKKREFEDFCDYDFFRFHRDAIQLYLGSDCFAFSSNLVPVLLREAQDSKNEECRNGHMGHDLTYLAYKASDVILRWVPVPQSAHFWYGMEMSPLAWAPELLSANSGTANYLGVLTSSPELPSVKLPQSIEQATENHGQMFYRPRVLVGIVTDSITFGVQTLRNRHRQLFNLWNDPRLCSLDEFRSRDWGQKAFFTSDLETDLAHDCQVVYSFILAAHDQNGQSSSFQNNATTLKLYDTPEQPLVLKALTHSTTNIDNIPFGDVLDNGDGTFLNLIENMNQGKTATFLFWASEISKQWNIPYVAKCDSDSFLNLTGFLNFLHQELPKIPVTGNGHGLLKQPSVFAGSPMLRKQRDSNWWLSSTDDSFWEHEYFLGSRLYYNGGFYLMSRDLAESSTNESRRLEHHVRRIVNHETRQKRKMNLWEDQPHEYLEGTEDVDAFGTAEYGHYRVRMDNPDTAPSVIQWMNIPHESVFHLHPVKVKNRLKWKALWARENRYLKERSKTLVTNLTVNGSVTYDNQNANPSNVKTLIVIYGANTHAEREKYRTSLFAQGKRVCAGLEPLSDSRSDKDCSIHYLFVVGRDDVGVNIPAENINDLSTLVWSDSTTPTENKEIHDVLVLNVQGTNLEGVGLSTLFYIQEKFQGNSRDDRYDLILFAKASRMVNIEQWEKNIVSTAQYSVRNERQVNLLIGDVRDKGKKMREYTSGICDNPLGAFKYHKHYSPHQMQLYLGSDCFAISSSVVSLWLEQARNPHVGRCMEGHLGHDLTYLSHFSGANLHWMRVPKSLQFWTEL